MRIFKSKEKTEGRDGWRAVLYPVLAFLIPFIVMVVGLEALHVTPFGEHSLAISDGQYYINGLMFFGRLVKGAENVLYSFKNGLGGNEWSQLAWGGFAPVSAFAALATAETMPVMFTWISVTNMSLCGLTMYILLAGLKGHRQEHLIFSTSYAMIGFLVANCYQTLFFIGPQMLPLVALGLDRLIRGRSPLLYVLSLAFCIFSNFYFGFMLCVASVLIFLARLYAAESEIPGGRGRLFARYAASSVIAGLLAAPMWLPALKAYSGGGRLNQTAWTEFTFDENMPFIHIFSKLFTGANSTSQMVIGLPNLFCGILVVALTVLYFMNRGIALRRRRAAGAVLCFYLLSFYITALTLVMHGGTHTNWFPYRYSYVFSFLLIALGSEQFEYLDEWTVQDTKRCGLILLVCTILVFSVQYEFINAGSVLLDYALLLLMWFVWHFYKTKPEKATRRTLVAFLLLVVCGNLYANYVISIYKVKDWELKLADYNEHIAANAPLVDAMNRYETGFFRMEKDISDSTSVGADPYLYGYNGVSHSGPADRMFVHKGLNRIGINWYDMRHWYSEGIPAATDVLLGLKYLISSRDLAEEKGYELKLDASEQCLYQNPYALSVAILADAPVSELTLGSDVFSNLNDIWRAMTGGDRDVFIEQEDVNFRLFNDASNQTVTSRQIRESVSNSEAGVEPEKPEGTYIEYSFVARRDGPVYIVTTSVPDSIGGSVTPYIKYLGYHRVGEMVRDTLKDVPSDITGAGLRLYCSQLAVAYADIEALTAYAAQLNARDISFTVENEANPRGEFTAAQDQRILFTMPWDEGWRCFIDGAEVPVDKTWDLFMSVAVPEGHHTWEMRFFPAWMDYGLYLCDAAIVGLVILMAVWAFNRRKAAKSVAAVDEGVAA